MRVMPSMLPTIRQLNWQRIAIALGIIAFALFVWPTVWRYERAYNQPYRFHRITGEVQRFTGSYWQTK